MRKYISIQREGQTVPTKTIKGLKRLIARAKAQLGKYNCTTHCGNVHVWSIEPNGFAPNRCKSKRKKGGDTRKKRNIISFRASFVGIKN